MFSNLVFTLWCFDPACGGVICTNTRASCICAFSVCCLWYLFTWQGKCLWNCELCCRNLKFIFGYWTKIIGWNSWGFVEIAIFFEECLVIVLEASVRNGSIINKLVICDILCHYFPAKVVLFVSIMSNIQ